MDSKVECGHNQFISKSWTYKKVNFVNFTLFLTWAIFDWTFGRPLPAPHRPLRAMLTLHWFQLYRTSYHQSTWPAKLTIFAGHIYTLLSRYLLFLFYSLLRNIADIAPLYRSIVKKIFDSCRDSEKVKTQSLLPRDAKQSAVWIVITYITLR